MMYKILLLFFIILLSQENSLGQVVTEADSIVYKTNKYQITYPEYLNINDSKRDGTEFIIYTSKTTETDDFIENINLVSQDLTNMDLDLDGFVEITRNELQGVGEIIESERVMAKKYEYHRMVYTSTQNGIRLTFLQHGLIANNTLYMLTFSSKSDSFEEYYPEMEQVMLSFTPI